jgi:hypothetical protein
MLKNELAGVVNFINPSLDNSGKWKTPLPNYLKSVTFKSFPTLALVSPADRKRFKASDTHFYHCSVATVAREAVVSVKPGAPSMNRFNWIRSKLGMIDETPPNRHIPPNREIVSNPSKVQLTSYYQSKYGTLDSSTV